MTPDERHALLRLKIDRADKHIRELDAATVAFMATEPYRIEFKRDPVTRRPIYYVTKVKPVPQDITVVMGDVIQALRTALDHLAYQLFMIGTNGSSGAGKHVCFPIADDAVAYGKTAARRMKGMRQDAQDRINNLELYGGGKGNDFFVLHRLNNTDKHRALVAAGSSFRSLDLIPIMMGILPASMKEKIALTVEKAAFFGPTARRQSLPS